MKKRLLVGAGSAVAAAAAAALFGTGTATAAPDVVGDTYADAIEAIEEDGGSAVVTSRVGDKLEQDECIVVNAWDSSFLRIDSSDEQVSLTLNCFGPFATANNPGASVQNPLGREAKSAAEEEAEQQEQQELEEAATPDE